MSKAVAACLLVAAVLIPFSAFAASHYVRAGATGTGSGDDWVNAYPALPTTLIRGDTYYLADGIYGAYNFNTPKSGNSVITVKKATIDDHGTAVGWSNTYGDGSASFHTTSNSSVIHFATDYWVFDGQVGGGPGSWRRGHGFRISRSQTSSGPNISISSTNIQLRHFEAEGRGPDGAQSIKNDIVFLDDAAGYVVISHAYLHNAGRTIFFHRGSNVTVEYTYTGYFESTSTEHSEIASIGNVGYKPGPSSNWTFRWSVFTHGEGSGGILYNGSNLQVYGCVFVNLPGSSWTGNGAVATWSWGAMTDSKIYNNSFIDVGVPIGNGTLGTLTGDFRNNIFYSSGAVQPGSMTHDYNHYVSQLSGGEQNGTAGAANPFVDYVNLDFRLTTATAAGQTLIGDYARDATGIGRGSDGAWDRGAYEFSSGESILPAPPTNLTSVVR